MVETVYKIAGAPRIALLADLHGRPYDHTISSLQAHRPSLVCVVGDILYGSHPEGDLSPLETQENVLPFLSGCAAVAPTFLSLGNHEWMLDEADLERIAATGVVILDNDYKTINMTKSISRFARNMAECAEMIQELRSLGVNLIFEKENISTQDAKGSLVLNIFAAIAQEESHSISQHTAQAHEQYTLEGRPFGRISYGYQNGGDNKWIINEDEAPRVRLAFQMAAEGRCYCEIIDVLNGMETGDHKWKQHRLKYLLTNVVYKGDYYSNATICIVPGKQVKNNGYRDRFYLKGHHEPIVSPELFDRVQEIVERGILITNRHWSAEDVEFMKGAITE